MSKVIVLYDGYSKVGEKDEMIANCSCTLITGLHNVIVDTMTAWDSEKVLVGFKQCEYMKHYNKYLKFAPIMHQYPAYKEDTVDKLNSYVIQFSSPNEKHE